jgi:hypothetical protein
MDDPDFRRRAVRIWKRFGTVCCRSDVSLVYVTLGAVPYLEVPVATTQTDDAGRFFLCRVNAPVGLVVGGIGYQPWSQLIPGTGDMDLEIELRR